MSEASKDPALPLLLAGHAAAAAAARLANAPLVAVARRCSAPYDADGRIRCKEVVEWPDLALVDRHPDVIALAERLDGSEQRVRPALLQRGWQYGGRIGNDRVFATGWWSAKLADIREANHGWYAPVQVGMLSRRDRGGRLRMVEPGGPTRIRLTDDHYWDTEEGHGRLRVVGRIDISHRDYVLHAPTPLPAGPWSDAVEALAAVAMVPGLQAGEPIDPGRVRHLAEFAASAKAGHWSSAEWVRGHRAVPAVRHAVAAVLRTAGWSAAACAAVDTDPSDGQYATLTAAIADEVTAQAKALSDYVGLAA